MKFKIGDRVRYCKAIFDEAENSIATIGVEGVIVAVLEGEALPYDVAINNVPFPFAFMEDELELV